MAPRLTKALAFLALGALIALACGGQSLEESGGGDSSAGGDAGNAGDGNGGTAGRGGTFTGGMSGSSPVGGTSSGGAFTGGMPSGGTFTGGTSAGGSSAGGVAGTGGAAGAGGVCSLPLVTGDCNAYFESFGFSATDGHCVPFVYGGCGGNDNRFASLAECEERCGGSLSTCPPELPVSTTDEFVMCGNRGQVCTYDFGNCLCARVGESGCARVDSGCGISVDAGVEPIIVVAYQRCTCELDGWNCQLVTTGGR
ncbi:MAG TPA: BPTI/Kunitz domain-containing protein [Polyangiaceae bacterium]